MASLSQIPLLGPFGESLGQQLAVKTGATAHPVPSALNQRYTIVQAAASKYHINPVMLWGVYGKETSHGANVTTSSAGAKGSFQFIESTAKAYNYPYTNATDTATFTQQADAAAHYLSALLPGGKGEAGLTRGKGGNWGAAWDHAIRAYSGGGYGAAEVIKAGSAAHTAVANEAANQQEAREVNHPTAGSGEGLWAELLAGFGKLAVTGVLLIAGAALVVYGIMVAVRPRERAMAIPRPGVVI
jgi:hypothetical protein